MRFIFRRNKKKRGEVKFRVVSRTVSPAHLVAIGDEVILPLPIRTNTVRITFTFYEFWLKLKPPQIWVEVVDGQKQ